MLHGFLGSGEDFAPLAQRLPSQVNVLALDLPGHGRTLLDADDPAWSVEGCADAILAWLDAEGIAAPHLFGYSMGGRIALRLAIAAPSRFGAIVIESASPGLETADARAQRRHDDAGLAARLLGMPLERFIDDWYAQPLFASLAASAAYAELRALRLRGDPVGLARALTCLGSGAQQSLWPRLGELHRPVHLVVGAQDARYRDIAARMAALAPAMRVRVFAGAGHNVHVEQPERHAGYLAEVFAARTRGEA